MEKELIESMKTKSREERKAFFEANKSELLSDDLAKVNGGGKDDGLQNPNSDVPDFANRWWSSFGYVCKGDSWC